jgi:hypothetical protein
MAFEEATEPDEAATEFVRRAQAIRWDLWNLLGSLDNVEAPAGATQWSVMQAIDHLGLCVRAEAAHVDGLDPDPAELFTEGALRRQHREMESELAARDRRGQMGIVPQPETPQDERS